MFRSEIEKTCKLLLEEKDDISSISSMAFPNNKCTNPRYESFLEELQIETSFDSTRRFYIYKCNELGGMVTTTSFNQIFGTKLPLSYFITICSDLFGIEYTKSFIEKKLSLFNEYFGGRNPPNIRNFLFSYGEYDSTKVVGVDPNKFNVTIIPRNIIYDLIKI